MILSFHPIITADKNIICAGRDPGEKERQAVRQADAVILSQGCRQSLYELAIAHCPHVFPDYCAKFAFPGKIGQSGLFAAFDLPHPRTEAFARLEDFFLKTGYPRQKLNFDLPFVFKFDWGGEGDTVLRIDSLTEFDNIIHRVTACERTGQYGFLIQEFIPAPGSRSLRVVVVGQKRIAYWRIPTDPDRFGTALSKGAIIDKHSHPELQAAGVAAVDRLCEKTGINLAGIDLIFPIASDTPQPLLLEINYFFGRIGIGGSQRYYEILDTEVRNWLKRIAA